MFPRLRMLGQISQLRISDSAPVVRDRLHQEGQVKGTNSILQIVVCVCLFVSIGAFGQRTTATLYGTVQDSSGAVIAKAKVQLIHEQTGAEHIATTDERGGFTLTFLAVGVYRLEVQAVGFKAYSRRGLRLDAGQQLRYPDPITMEVGPLAEKITVAAEAPVIENASTTLSDRYSSSQLTELPQSRRDFTAFLALEPGYRPVTQGSGGMIQFNGLASGGANVTVDGVVGSGDTETPGPTMFQNYEYIKIVSKEAIQEVHVSKGAMSAEVANTFSGNINVITKAGTNEFHGSLFENFQNDALNARYALLRP